MHMTVTIATITTTATTATVTTMSPTMFTTTPNALGTLKHNKAIGLLHRIVKGVPRGAKDIITNNLAMRRATININGMRLLPNANSDRVTRTTVLLRLNKIGRNLVTKRGTILGTKRRRRQRLRPLNNIRNRRRNNIHIDIMIISINRRNLLLRGPNRINMVITTVLLVLTSKKKRFLRVLRTANLLITRNLPRDRVTNTLRRLTVRNIRHRFLILRRPPRTLRRLRGNNSFHHDATSKEMINDIKRRLVRKRPRTDNSNNNVISNNIASTPLKLISSTARTRLILEIISRP